ncbi:YecR family lipoprotein [Aquipseudomonas alcaligenes]|uniref:YecR family lipoprotein n=1 Tax=Aquipseudomonas alcaligenes TaxID=43263 RepID=UPI0037496014
MRAATAVLFVCALAALTGCAVKKDFYATGGSRADGTVDLAYDLKAFEKPVVDYKQAQRIAEQKCQVWGYVNAEPFGGQTTTCSSPDGFGGCDAGQVVIKYQCLGGDGVASTPAPSVQPAATADDLTKEQWKQQQLQELQKDTTLGYDEYMKRRKAILDQ